MPDCSNEPLTSYLANFNKPQLVTTQNRTIHRLLWKVYMVVSVIKKIYQKTNPCLESNIVDYQKY
jgi:hypothetical protein